MKIGDNQVITTQNSLRKTEKPTVRSRGSGSLISTGRSAGVSGFDMDSDIQEYLKELQKQFPGAKICSTDAADTSAQGIRDYAQSNYGTMQILLSPKVLRKMMSDPEFKKSCEKLISETRKALYAKAGQLQQAQKQVIGSGMVLDEDGNISQWIASKESKPDRISDLYLPSTVAKHQDGYTGRIKMKDGTTITFRKKLSYRPTRDLARIARASSQQMVKTAMGGIRASIYQLKSSGGDKKVVSQFVGQAEQVLLKAQIKVKNLKKEELIQSAEKKAAAESDQKRAAYLRRILQERKTKRTVREYGQIRDHYPTPQEIRREEDEVKEWVESITGTSGIEGYGQQSYLPANGVVQTEQIGTTSGNTGVFIDITL